MSDGVPAALAATDRVLDESENAFFGSDVYRSHAVPRAVVRPETLDELRQAVLAAVGEGLAIHTRGGGVSYTDAHLPLGRESIVIDTSALDSVIAIDETDMLVTVEPGISWERLDAALAPRGLKVPFVGTFSGIAASVGGTISQNANGHGSNANGISADSVVAVEVMDAAGEIVRTGTTGSGAKQGRFRNYGPDLAGLFLGDSGALGIKTAVTLRLLRRRPHAETASFAFADFGSLHACMSQIAGMKLEEKSFGLDLKLSQGQIAKQDTGTAISVAKGVWKSSPNALSAIGSLARLARAGKRVLASAPFATHYICDGFTPTEARAKLETVRKVALRHGREIANSVPTVVRAMPFQPLHNMLGPQGERWVPLHGLLPHSRVAAFHSVFESYVASRQPEMERHNVFIGAMFSAIGPSTFLYEPALYWQDELAEYHLRMMEPAYLSGLPRYPANPQGAALVEEMRTDLIAIMAEHGAGHFQVGKLYPYPKGRDPGALKLLRAVKREMDPEGLLNPGALGLE
jgi:D-lactate dehydrogenase (cytochrome)